MKRTTMILSIALVIVVITFILRDDRNGLLPIDFYGSPTVEPFMELPSADVSENVRSD